MSKKDKRIAELEAHIVWLEAQLAWEKANRRPAPIVVNPPPNPLTGRRWGNDFEVIA